MLIRLLFFSLCSMVWSNQSLASSDIEMLEKWNELSLQSIRNSSVSSQLSSLLTQHINQQVSRIATENKIPELYLNDELWDLIKKDLRKKIQSAVAQPRSKRMVALMHVVEQHTGQSYSHKMLASHLGFKPVSTYLMNSAETNASSVKVAKPSLLSQASVRQQSSEIKINLNNSSTLIPGRHTSQSLIIYLVIIHTMYMTFIAEMTSAMFTC